MMFCKFYLRICMQLPSRQTAEICTWSGNKIHTKLSYPVVFIIICYCCSVTKLCLTLFGPGDCSLSGSSLLWIVQARILSRLHFLLQGIFPAEGSNLHLLNWQADTLPLNHLGTPFLHMPHINLFLFKFLCYDKIGQGLGYKDLKELPGRN